MIKYLEKVSEKWYYVVADLFSKASIYFLTLVFSYLVSPDDFGSLSLYNSLFTIFFVFVSLNLTNNYITKKKLDKSSNFSEILSSIITFLCIINIFFMIIAGIILIFNVTFYSISSILLFCGLISAILNCNYELLQTLLVTEKEKKKYLIIGVSFSILTIILSFLLILFNKHLSIYAIIISKVVLLLFFTLYSFIFMKKRYKIKLQLDKYIIKDALMFSFPLIMHSLSGFILNYIDKFMLNDMENLSSTAIYSFSYNIASVMMVISLALNKALLPKFFPLKKENKNKKIEKIITKDLSLITYLFIGYVTCVGLIYQFFPSSYNEYFSTFLLLTFNYLIFYGYNIYSNYLYYAGNTYKIFTNTLISSIINLVLNYILIPKFSGFGAAISTIISFIALFLLYYISVRKQEKEYYPISKLLIYFVIGAIYSLCYYLIYKYFILKVVCLLIILFIGYVIFIRKKVEVES